MEASAAAQVYPNALRPTCKELLRDAVMKSAVSELGVGLVDNEG